MPVSKDGKVYFTNEQKELAMQRTNALEYAKGRYELVRRGNEYHLKEHDSMVFTMDGRWFWNSRGLHGDALDFIQHYEGKSYAEAVVTLAGEAGSRQDQEKAYRAKEADTPSVFILPERSEDYRMLFAYLIKTRGIDREIVSDMIKDGRLMQVKRYSGFKICGYDEQGKGLYIPSDPDHVPSSFSMHSREVVSYDGVNKLEEKKTVRCLTAGEAEQLVSQGKIRKYHNVAMLGCDPEGIVKYCSLRSMNTQGKSFKIDVPGSSKRCPFFLPGSPDSTTVVVVESPIEAMSYRNLCLLSHSKHADFPVLSQGGAGVSLGLDAYLERNPQISHLVFALNRDNDGKHKQAAGELATERLMQKYKDHYQVSVHQPALNDWNDVLCRWRELHPVQERNISNQER